MGLEKDNIIFQTVDNGIIILDDKLNILAWNRWLEIYTKLDESKVLDKNICEIFPYIDKKKLTRKVKSVLFTKHPAFYSADPHKYLINIPVSSIINKSYNSLQQNVTIVPYNLEKKQVCIYLYDITALCETNIQLEKLNNELEDMSHRDPLTNLFNRRYFSLQSQKIQSFALRNEFPLSIIILDIDNFKNINDTYGHMVGDDVLIKVAMILEKVVRNSDIIARFGGEEFVILLQNSDKDSAFLVAEKIRKELESCTVEVNDDKVKFTSSFGIAQFDEKLDNANLEHTMSRADKALYESKKSGKNKTSIYS